MLPDRRRLVLKAFVEEYITSGQPVGSKHLVDRHGLTCSPATVRNELAALEESGHVFQPHVSGRIPTDAGTASSWTASWKWNRFPRQGWKATRGRATWNSR